MTWSSPGSGSASPRWIPVALAGLVLLLGAFAADQWRQNRALQSQVRELQDDVSHQVARNADLESEIDTERRAAHEARARLELVQFRVEAVELQLDGIDRLSRQVRDELGLPPSAATWSDEAGAALPQGGPGGGLDGERLDTLQARLAAGADELVTLLGAVHARDAAPTPPESLEHAMAPSNWPIRGMVTSHFGWRVFRGLPNYHRGIDVAVPYGTGVQATGHGTVVGSGWQPGFGTSVLVSHPGGYHTLYAHLSHLLVEVGDTVEPGALVGLSGSSGNSTGPHVHYEIWKDGRSVDPRPYMDGRSQPSGEES